VWGEGGGRRGGRRGGRIGGGRRVIGRDRDGIFYYWGGGRRRMKEGRKMEEGILKPRREKQKREELFPGKNENFCFVAEIRILFRELE
jgi:hypothetical protein